MLLLGGAHGSVPELASAAETATETPASTQVSTQVSAHGSAHVPTQVPTQVSLVRLGAERFAVGTAELQQLIAMRRLLAETVEAGGVPCGGTNHGGGGTHRGGGGANHGGGGASQGGGALSLPRLRATLCNLLREMDVPWSGYPPGWSYEGGVYRSIYEPSLVTRAKPTEAAAALLARRAAGKGSLERARADAAARREAAVQRHAAEAAAAAAPAAAAAAPAPPSTTKAAAAANDELAAGVLEKAASAQAEAKALALAQARASEARELRAAAAGSRAAALKSVTALLAELELERYSDAFETAGYDDERLRAVADLIDEDAEGDGANALEVRILF